MKFQIQKITIFLIAFVSFFVVVPRTFIKAQVYDSVNFTVEISICGDFIVEGQEDCEWLDLNGGTCESLGFQSGDLFCDISCEYETGWCVPFPEPVCGDGSLDSGEECELGDPPGNSCVWSSCNQTSCLCEEEPEEPEEPAEPEEPEIPEEPTIEPEDTGPFIPSLPGFIKYYDINGDGKIDSSEVSTSVQLWVNIWRNVVYDEGAVTCDLNQDEDCNVYDFSILMYYVEN